jgi:hypothetical protein
MSIVGMTVLVGAVQPAAAKRDAVEACLTIKAGKTKVLDADVNCHQSGTPPDGAVGVNMETNTTLDCNGFKIIGPNIPYDPEENAEEYHGIYAQKRRRVTVKNCRVEKYTRGLHFDGVRTGKVSDSHFDGNNRYGAALINKASFDNLWERNTYNQNGDEGLHLSGEFKKGTTKPNKFLDSEASGNDEEGWYLLNANYVQLDHNSATDNGLDPEDGLEAAVYVKNSSNNTIQYMTLTNNPLQLIGNSDSNNINNVTVVGGWVKLQSNTEGTPPVTSSPNNNTFDHVCVQYSAVNQQPGTAFQFNGVVTGGNTFTNSAALLIAGKDHVGASNGSSGDTFTLLYIVPSTLKKDVDETSSVTITTTTTPPTCYGD